MTARPNVIPMTLVAPASTRAVAAATRVAPVVKTSSTRTRVEAGSGSAFRNSNSALVLVDDVFTTGATIAAAAQALESAGARGIMGITFGRAVIPDFT